MGVKSSTLSNTEDLEEKTYAPQSVHLNALTPAQHESYTEASPSQYQDFT